MNHRFILAEFVFLHYHTIATLWFSMNPRVLEIAWERMALVCEVSEFALKIGFWNTFPETNSLHLKNGAWETRSF